MRAASAWRFASAALALTALAAPAQAIAPAAAPLTIRVGEAKDLSRIEFHWAGTTRVSSRRDGQALVLRFSRNATADFSRLRVDPPRFLKTAAVAQTPQGLQLTMQLTPDADAKVGEADGATYVNLFARKPDPSATQASTAGAPAIPSTAPQATVSVSQAQAVDAVPASGVVKVQAQDSGGQLLLRFPWKAPLGSAVFRRGDALWIVFDASARLDLSALKGHGQIVSARAVSADGVTALRIDTPGGLPVTANAEGAVWTIALGIGTQAQPAPVAIGRDGEALAPTLAAAVAGATKIAWIADPVVGDRLAVVTARSPSKGLPSRRDFIEMSALPSAQGLAIERAPEDLSITSDGDTVRFTRPGGLKLSPMMGKLDSRIAAMGDLPRPASMPALIDFDGWSRTGSAGFTARYDHLLNLAAMETDREVRGDKAAGVGARMALARFLVGSQLSFEAIGALDLLSKSHQEMLTNAEFRGLRGAAKAMAGRYKEAQTDFAAPILADDPSSALWRGYADEKLGHYAEARTEFQNGQRAMGLTAPMWRARFARADAEAALGLNDFNTAAAETQAALAPAQPPEEQLRTRLVQARLIESRAGGTAALPLYQAISRASLDEVAAPATLHATQIRLASGQVTPAQAAQTFDSLRFRWRGDAVELGVIRALGQLYLNQGRYREALEALRSAGARLPDLPEAMQLQADLGSAFRALFLQGQADGLQPVQALALFYDFKELTPIGAEGDEMVRKLAQRLVNVDLLDQAASLLKYQADNRLDGVPRAIVSTDEALIDVMARKPEAALEALNSSRTTLLPASLNSQRRMIESRAWMQLNQLDHALEILGDDNSADAQTLRAEIAWRRKDWAQAGRMYEVGLGHRFDATVLPLTPDEEQRLLRAGIAYSLARDEGALARLRGRYGGFVPGAHAPESLRVALAGSSDIELNAASFAHAVSEDESFEGWVQKMKQRLRDRASPAGILPPTLSTAQAGGGAAKG